MTPNKQTLFTIIDWLCARLVKANASMHKDARSDVEIK